MSGKTHVTSVLVEILKALPLSIVAIVGIYFTAAEHQARQPNVVVGFIGAQLGVAPVDPTKITQALEAIEADFSDLSGHLVLDLIESSNRLASGAQDDFEQFRQLYGDTIRHMKSRPALVAELLTLQERIVSEELPIERIEQILTDLESEYYDASDLELLILIGWLMEDAGSRIEGDALRVFDELIDLAIANLRDIDDLIAPLRERMEEEVGALLQKVEEDIGLRLYVDASIENRSRVPTVVRKNAVLRVWNDDASHKDIEVDLNTDLVVEGITVKQGQFRSRELGELDASVRDFLTAAFLKNEGMTGPKCLMFLMDMHENVWDDDSKCSTTSDSMADKLKEHMDRVFDALLES